MREDFEGPLPDEFWLGEDRLIGLFRGSSNLAIDSEEILQKEMFNHSQEKQDDYC